MKRPIKERPIFPGKLFPRKNLSDERGVSPVIAVILMVAITVVLAAVLYVMVMNLINIDPPAPNGAVNFDESGNEKGTYVGRIIRIDKQVKLKDLSITITDSSTSRSASMAPLSDGAIASCGPGEFNITYDDINENEELDAADVFVVHNGESDDVFVLTYTKGSGGQICEFKLD
jgi:flagellin-like protein